MRTIQIKNMLVVRREETWFNDSFGFVNLELLLT